MDQKACETIIELNNVSKDFALKDKKVHALRGVSISVKKGDIFGIIGYSGAGKSTLIRTINYLETPDQGTVVVRGKELGKMNKKQLLEMRRSVGMIFQHFNLLSSANVYDNIAAPLRNHTGLSKQEIDDKVRAMLHLVDLDDKEKAYPSQLSGGQKQRVAIARALCNDPDILLCDEATSALDPNTTKSILALIRKINRELGITVVIITHQMEVVKAICNRVAVMDNGIIAEQGQILDIFSNPQTSIGREFIAQSMHDEEVLAQYAGTGKKLYRLSYVGGVTEQPVVAELVERFGVKASILFGNVENLAGSTFGNLIVDLIGNDEMVEQSIVYLQDQGVKVEVIQNV